MARPVALRRDDFPHFEILTTRWNDNDAYGHMNNVVHYQLFDTAVNSFLIRAGVLDIRQGETVFLVVSSGCDYFGELAFPDQLKAGVRVAKLGSSSVHYEIGLFREDDQEAAAQGRFVHVHVDRKDRKPQPLSRVARDLLSPLVVAG